MQLWSQYSPFLVSRLLQCAFMVSYQRVMSVSHHWIWVSLVSSIDQMDEMEGTVGSFLSFSPRNVSTCPFLTLPPNRASLLKKGIHGGEPTVFSLHVANPQTCEKTEHEIAEITSLTTGALLSPPGTRRTTQRSRGLRNRTKWVLFWVTEFRHSLK